MAVAGALMMEAGQPRTLGQLPQPAPIYPVQPAYYAQQQPAYVVMPPPHTPSAGSLLR